MNSVDGEKGDAGEYISEPVAAPEPTVEPLLPVLPTIRRLKGGQSDMRAITRGDA
jgi:hypothetical protein